MDKGFFYICVFVLGFVFFGYYLFGVFAIDLILLGLLSLKKPEWFR
jgi:hypothetical protein